VIGPTAHTAAGGGVTLPPSPIKQDLRLGYICSLVTAFGVAAVSAAGLVWGAGGLYPATPPSVLVSRAGDATNLIVILPSLLASMWLARRGSLIGLLLWPGALFYVLYTYAIYLVVAPFTVLIFAYMLLVILAAATLIGLIAGIDANQVRDRLAGTPARAVGAALVVLAVLAYAGLISTAVGMFGGSVSDLGFRPQWVVDCALGTPALLIGGALLWRRAPLGYQTAPGLLFVSALGGAAFVAPGILDRPLGDHPIEWPVIAVHLVISAISVGLLVFFLNRVATRQLPTPAPATTARRRSRR
jgi:hypothetical protein